MPSLLTNPLTLNYNSNVNDILENNNSSSPYFGVINLSDHVLSDSELSLLSKGLTFVNTPSAPDRGLIFEDVSKFHTSIRRKLAIDKLMKEGALRPPPAFDPLANKNIPFKHQKFKNASNWNPPGPSILETMCYMNETNLESANLEIPHKQNLRKAEVTALKSLKINQDIVIKKADKGSAVVILNRKDYINEGLKQLNDTNFYREQTNDLTTYHRNLVKIQVDIMLESKEIDPKCAEYLVIDNPRTANFYLLPKIHKGTIPPPGRPIVSANDCPTERISQFVDHFIQPLIPNLKSYIKDSGHFLWLLENINLPDNVILCTLDVTSLYTNIPNQEGISAVRQQLSHHRHPSENPTNHSICELLRLVLTCNNFQFDNKHYLQVGGTAMGTKLAPSFANIFMGWFEDNFVYTYKLKPLVWKRYIDDVFMIWQHGDTELKDFIAHLNTRHDTIKFTEESSRSSINFLDITVTLTAQGTLKTSLYCKPTDSHNYLLYSSEHPRHLLRGIPYSQFLRVRRICSDINDFRQNTLMLSSHFIRRGYPLKLVKAALLKAELQDRDTLIAKNAPSSATKPLKQDTDKPKFYLVTTHNPGNPPVRKIIESNWSLLNKSKTTRSINDAELIFGQRRNKNLSDQLVRASTKTTTTKTPNSIRHPCKRPKTCRYCPLIDRSEDFFSTTTRRKFYSMRNVNCQSSNLIYVITCRHCGIQYVGQTKNRILTRFQGHIFDISHDNDTTVARHFNRCPPESPSLVSGIIINVATFIPAPPDSRAAKLLRDKEEKRWMHRLQTITPRGLNLMD